VGEDGLVVEQITLRIEADDLTACAEAWVDAHHALLTKGSAEEQLTEVIGEDTDGLFVGLLLAEGGKLGLNRRFEQTLVAIFDGFGHKSATRGVAIDVMSLEAFDAFFIIG
jgi:hypothetical protein